MQKQKNRSPEPIKPDLKHDNMEYAASAEGDDILDADNETSQEIEAEDITAEELELLQKDDVDDLAAALNSAELDSLADQDNFLNEKEIELDFGVKKADKQPKRRRH